MFKTICCLLLFGTNACNRSIYVIDLPTNNSEYLTRSNVENLEGIRREYIIQPTIKDIFTTLLDIFKKGKYVSKYWLL